MLYAVQRARWTRALDQMVTGASAAAEFGHRRNGDYGMQPRERRGEEKEELTAMRQGRLAASGTLSRRRINDDDLRWPTRETAAVVALRRIRGLVAR